MNDKVVYDKELKDVSVKLAEAHKRLAAEAEAKNAAGITRSHRPASGALHWRLR